MTIDNQQVVALNYVLHTEMERITKSSCRKIRCGKSLHFLYGVGMMIPKFEESIKGLTSGDKASLLFCQQKVTAKEIPQTVAQLPLEMFNESGMPPVGAILPLSDNQGNNFQAVVVEVTPEVVVADLITQMAGKLYISM